MKARIIMTLVGSLAMAGSTHAAESLIKPEAIPGDFSAGVALTSEYFFRGISQTDDVPAIQGEIGYAYDFGPVKASLGLWASNVKFTDASIEIDYTAALGGDVLGVGWQVGGIYYSYPGANANLDYDFVEIFGTLGYDFNVLSTEVGVYRTADNFGDSGEATYVTAGISIPLGEFVDFNVSGGRYNIEKNTTFGVSDYWDYSIGVGANALGFDWSVAYTDTDLSDSECDDACGQVVLTVSASF